MAGAREALILLCLGSLGCAAGKPWKPAFDARCDCSPRAEIAEEAAADAATAQGAPSDAVIAALADKELETTSETWGAWDAFALGAFQRALANAPATAAGVDATLGEELTRELLELRRAVDGLEDDTYDDVVVLQRFEQLRQAYRDGVVALETALVKATVGVLGTCGGIRFAKESEMIEDVVYYVAKMTNSAKGPIRRIARERFDVAFRARMTKLCMPMAAPVAEELVAPIVTKRRLQWLALVK